MAYRIVPYKLNTYKRICRVDEDFVAHGEDAYFGFTSFFDYAAWLTLLRDNEQGYRLPPGWTPYELNLLVDEKDNILCLGQLRFGDEGGNTTWAGHIGYSVPPSLRGRGYAQIFLRLCLKRAWSLGAGPIMLTCDDDNAPSRHVIEKCGGQYVGFYGLDGYHKLQYMFYPERAREYGL